MDKAEHGPRLKAAMGRLRLSRQVVADAVGVKERTVTNWTSGQTMPSTGQLEVLRGLLGNYDSDGDPVEVAVGQSRLTDDRKHFVVGTYKRLLREQDEDEGRMRA